MQCVSAFGIIGFLALKDVLHLSNLLSLATPLTTSAKILASIILLGSLFLLIGGLTTGGGLKNKAQRPTVLVGLIGLLYEGSRLYWHFSAASLQSLGLASAYYFTYHFFGGLALALLLYLVFPKSPKAVLIISVSLLVAINVAFNIIVIAHFGRYRAWALLPLCNAGLIGTSIASAILLWLDRRRQRSVNRKIEMMDQGPAGR